MFPFGSETKVETEDLEVGVGMETGIVLQAEKEDSGMANFMCQLHRVLRCPDIWSNILGVSLRVFLDEIDISIS